MKSHVTSHILYMYYRSRSLRPITHLNEDVILRQIAIQNCCWIWHWCYVDGDTCRQFRIFSKIKRNIIENLVCVKHTKWLQRTTNRRSHTHTHDTQPQPNNAEVCQLECDIIKILDHACNCFFMANRQSKSNLWQIPLGRTRYLRTIRIYLYIRTHYTRTQSTSEIKLDIFLSSCTMHGVSTAQLQQTGWLFICVTHYYLLWRDKIFEARPM